MVISFWHVQPWKQSTSWGTSKDSPLDSGPTFGRPCSDLEWFILVTTIPLDSVFKMWVFQNQGQWWNMMKQYHPFSMFIYVYWNHVQVSLLGRTLFPPKDIAVVEGWLLSCPKKHMSWERNANNNSL
jgi:hypothetical protein